MGRSMYPNHQHRLRLQRRSNNLLQGIRDSIEFIIPTFTGFAAKLILKRSHKIERFRLRWITCFSLQVDLVGACIAKALERGVRELHLDLDPDFWNSCRVLPRDLVSDNLVSLQLRTKKGYGIRFRSPSQLRLSRLKVLAVDLNQPDPKIVEKMFSCENLPALEHLELSVDDGMWWRNDDGRCISIISPTLKRLRLSVERMPKFKILAATPALEYLTRTVEFSCLISCLLDGPALVEANAHLDFCTVVPLDTVKMVKNNLFRCLSSAQRLKWTVTPSDLDQFCKFKSYPLMFSHLKYLELTCPRMQCSRIVTLLIFFPELEVLVVNLNGHNGNTGRKYLGSVMIDPHDKLK